MRKPAERRQGEGQARFFVHAALFSSLFLAKFGIVAGHSYLPASLPVFVLVLFWATASGKVQVVPRGLLIYCILAGTVLLSAVGIVLNSQISEQFSVQSLALLLLLYSFFIFAPRKEFDTSIAIDIYLKYAMVLAALGILQYFGQYAGYKISSLSSVFPALKPILVEQFFNSDAVLESGSQYVRSNAIFLREPSTFSQLLVGAIVLEVAVKRRFKFLPIYIVAYLTSFSGTGLLSLVVALLLNSLFSVKQAIRLPFLALGGVIAVLVLSVLVPSVADRYSRRLDEFNSTGSSAYARYLSQGQAWSDMAADGSIVTGHGPGSFERSIKSVTLASNPVLKLTYDYGILPMLAAIILFISSIWISRARIISLLFIAIYQLGGGTELNPCFLVPVIVLIVWGLKHPNFRIIQPVAKPTPVLNWTRRTAW